MDTAPDTVGWTALPTTRLGEQMQGEGPLLGIATGSDQTAAGPLQPAQLRLKMSDSGINPVKRIYIMGRISGKLLIKWDKWTIFTHLRNRMGAGKYGKSHLHNVFVLTPVGYPIDNFWQFEGNKTMGFTKNNWDLKVVPPSDVCWFNRKNPRKIIPLEKPGRSCEAVHHWTNCEAVKIQLMSTNCSPITSTRWCPPQLCLLFYNPH